MTKPAIKPANVPIKRQLRDAQRIHKAEQYPGNLAADLGLKPKTPWLKRGLVALTAAAALVLAATVTVQWLAQNASSKTQPLPPIAQTPSDTQTQSQATANTPSHPVVLPAPSLAHTDLPINVAHDNLEKAQSRFNGLVAQAKQSAGSTLNQRWSGRNSLPTPCAGLASNSRLTHVGLPTFPTPTLSLPRGLRLPVSLTLTRPRKALS